MSTRPDIIVLIETNLNYNIVDSELGLNDYSIFRRDRYQNNLQKGGGILIAAKKSLAPGLVFCEYDFNCEQIYIKIYTGKKSFLIGAVYLPPQSSSDIFEFHVKTVEHL